jgi:hypothetical protein
MGPDNPLNTRASLCRVGVPKRPVRSLILVQVNRLKELGCEP